MSVYTKGQLICYRDGMRAYHCTFSRYMGTVGKVEVFRRKYKDYVVIDIGKIVGVIGPLPSETDGE